MKKTLILFIILHSITLGQIVKFGEARGLFMAVGVGPKFPIGELNNNSNIGVGFDVTLSYTDNIFIPFFLYTTVGYGHFPGRQDLYKKSDYSSFSSNVLLISSGIRYYFPPLLESVVLLMPIVDAGIEYAYFENLHQFKIDKNKQNFLENFGRFGFQAGMGFSMFILDVITYYNYLPSNQHISFVIKANIPIFVKF
ncbi:MAG: hypothetical protein N2249_04345 [Melioribacter sp.]|nr:hypothetical protein [Melioribacter sp.]